MRSTILVALLSGCTPGLWAGDYACDADGFRIEEEVKSDCTQYSAFVSRAWGTLVSRGWVREMDKSSFQAIPIRVWGNWNFVCDGEQSSGCYVEGDHIETGVTLGALPHEWLHHADWLDSVRDDHHQGWQVRGSMGGPTGMYSLESIGCLVSSWCDETYSLERQQYYDYVDANPF